MPFSPTRFNRLLDIKQVTQQRLAAIAAVAQSQISDCTRGTCRTNELTEKLAVALDCTPDFLLGWSFPEVDDDDELFRAAVSRMALDAFEKRDVSDDQKSRCRKVLRHRAAPVTADAWAILSEQIELAIGPTNGGTVLHVVRSGGA